MNAVKGTVKNGRVILNDLSELPEGVRVLVDPITDEETFGVHEEDWQDTPEAIARWISAFDAIPPLQMTPEEEAAWRADREAQKNFEKARFFEHAEKLRRMWE